MPVTIKRPQAEHDEEAGIADKPEYRVYRSRPGLLRRLFYRDSDRERFAPPRPEQSAQPQTAAGQRPPAAPPAERRGLPSLPSAPREIPWRRIAKWTLVVIVAWFALSVVLFMISAQIQSDKVPKDVRRALDDGGNMLTSANNILVLGSDRRPGESGPSRADTIMLMRYGGGKAARLSIPRDTLVNIPGHGPDKINAAYAFGGPALMIRTVKDFLGIEVNHLVEVDFEGFPKFVDAMGGVKMKFDTCIVSRFEGRTPHIGCEGNFRRCKAVDGNVKLDGQDALDVVRIRKNRCAPEESDLTRARRQQKFLEAVKGRVYSPFAFPRLPWAAWRAPRAVRTDMAGPALLALFFDSEVAGSLEPSILRPIDPGANPLQVSDADKQAAVDAFLEG
jgi:LCP family protein required for cell wall assembly